MTKKFKRGKQIADVTEAKGVKGFILREFGTDRLFFRVYDKTKTRPEGGWEFTDYDITHSDLEIEIIGESAFYSMGERNLLDHSPQTLGLVEIEQNL